ncbi:T9SS type A sorting domain-containing protein [Portibacter marinus]|uniref:T9SS type A sorting domain-containing protein n=1 Tax=Portibacter marinus TaxID=2898660 RepID=UPI001F3CFA69|nr:T9SS type A sorting domain-containing protein [Portibacter marinus]
MKRFYLLMLITACAAWSFAQSVETFDYVTGETLIGKDGGTGFSTAWEDAKSTEQAVIGEGGIEVPAIAGATTNNHLYIAHDGEGGPRLVRLLAEPVTDDGNTYYMSWIMDADYDDPAANGSVFQTMLIIAGGLGPSGPGGQTVRMGKIFNTERFGVDGQRVSGGAKFIEGTDTRDAYWAVAIIQMSGDEMEETISIFINPDTSEGLDPVNADLQFTAELNTGFDAIGAKLEGGANLEGRLDELRFGSSLEEVTPMDLIAIDPIPVAASEPFNYDVADSLNAKDGGDGFASAWEFKKGNDQAVIGEGGLEVEAINAITSNNHLLVSHVAGESGARFIRNLEVPVKDDGETYWMSWIMDNDYENPEENGSVFQTMILLSAGFGASGPGGQTVRMGKIFNTINFGVDGQRVAGGSKFIDETDTREAYWAVARIDMSGDENNETISIYINQDASNGLDTMNADLIFEAQLNEGFDAIGAKLEGPASLTGFLDDLRFGPRLIDVIPDDLGVLNTGVVLSSEPFDYEVGDTLNLLSGGRGWLDSWDTKKGNIQTSIKEGGLGVESLNVLTSNNHLQIDHLAGDEGVRGIRKLEVPVTDDGDVYWMSWFMDVDFEDVESNGSVFQAMLLKSAGFGAAGPGGQVVRMGKIFNTENVGVDGQRVTGGVKLLPGTDTRNAYWAVARIEMSGDDADETIALYINQNATNGLDTNSANLIFNAQLNDGFDAVGFKLEGGAPLVGFMDDLRFGPSLESVVPEDLEVLNVGVVPAFEKFDYAEGESLEGKAGGIGFSTNWQLKKGDAQTIIESGGIDILSMGVATSGNSLAIIHNEGDEGVRFVRDLTSPVPDDGETYYLSWVMDSDYSLPEENGSVLQAMIIKSAGFGAGGPGGQMVRMGKIANSSNFGVDGQRVTGGGGAVEGTSTMEAYWAIAEIKMSGDDTDETIHIYINPDVSDGLDALTPDAVVTAQLNDGFEGIGAKLEGPSALNGKMDELRFGPELEDVIPDDLEALVPGSAYDGFDYEVGSSVEGLNGGEGWSGPWSTAEGAVDAGTIAEGSISSDRTDGIANKYAIQQDNNVVSAQRSFRLAYGLNPGEVWSSTLIDVESKGIGNQLTFGYVNQNDEMIAGFGGAQGLAQFVFFDGEFNATTSEIDLTGPKWVVSKFVFNDDSDDQLFMWINPTADAIPAENNADYTLSGSFENGVNSFKVVASGVQATTANIDELRMGISFREVSPKFGSDDPNLIAYEPFNYDAGDEIVGSGGINAFWDGTWQNFNPLEENVQLIAESSLQYQDVEESIGNKARIEFVTEGTEVHIDRPLAFPLVDDGRTYWLTFLMNSEETPARNNVGNITLRNTNEGNKQGQMIAFGRIYGTGNLGAITPQNNNPTAIEDKPDVGLNWIVVKMVMNGTEEPDSVFMWVNPDPYTEPDTANADHFRRTPYLNNGIDVIRMKVAGAGADQVPYNLEFDEIRLATEWQSATFPSNTIELDPQDVFELLAYPNPAQSEINIEFEIKKRGSVSMDLYDNQGRLVRNLVTRKLAKGKHFVTENISNLQNGFYYLRLKQDNQSTLRKIIIFK